MIGCQRARAVQFAAVGSGALEASVAACSLGVRRTHSPVSSSEGRTVPQSSFEDQRRYERCGTNGVAHRGIAGRRNNRTLEVWGSIPHGSTRKTKPVRSNAGRFVFGRRGGPFRARRRKRSRSAQAALFLRSTTAMRCRVVRPQTDARSRLRPCLHGSQEGRHVTIRSVPGRARALTSSSIGRHPGRPYSR